MVDYTSGAMHLPYPEDTDPIAIMPATVEDLANAIESGIADSVEFTPGLDAVTTAPTLGTGSVAVCRFVVTGGWCSFVGRFKFGSSGAAAGSGVYRIQLPPLAVHPDYVEAQMPLGTAMLHDDSTNTTVYRHLAHSSLAGWARVDQDDGTSPLAHNAPWTWAALDKINYQGRFPVDLDA